MAKLCWEMWMIKNIKNNLNYIWFLLISLLNWIMIVILIKYAIIGKLNIWILLIITIVMVFYGFMNLTLGRDKLYVKVKT